MNRHLAAALHTAVLSTSLAACGCAGPAPEHGHEEAHGSERRPAADHRSVHLAPEAVERMQIRIAEVAEAPVAGGFEVPAEVTLDPDRVAHVSPMVAGQLARVAVSIGDDVTEGQVLAVMRSVELGATRAEAARARAEVDIARANHERHLELQREGIGSERQSLEAEAELRRAEAALSAAERALAVYGRGGRGTEIVLRSPIEGSVFARHATVGEVATPSDVLFEVTNVDRVWVVGHVFQRDAGRVTVGTAATLALPAYPGRTFAGTLDYVAPALDEQSRTLAVRMTLENPEGMLRPGLFGTLTLGAEGSPGGAVAVVSGDAVQRVEDAEVVFVPGEEDGVFHAVPVATTPGRRGERVVTSGLTVGDRYVAEGGFVLKSELLRSELGEGHAH